MFYIIFKESKNIAHHTKTHLVALYFVRSTCSATCLILTLTNSERIIREILLQSPCVLGHSDICHWSTGPL